MSTPSSSFGGLIARVALTAVVFVGAGVGMAAYLSKTPQPSPARLAAYTYAAGVVHQADLGVTAKSLYTDPTGQLSRVRGVLDSTSGVVTDFCSSTAKRPCVGAHRSASWSKVPFVLRFDVSVVTATSTRLIAVCVDARTGLGYPTLGGSGPC